MKSRPVDFYDNQPIDIPNESEKVCIERIYCFDWDLFSDSDWTTLNKVYEQLPSWKGYAGSGPGKGCPYWYSEDEDSDSYLTASVEPPGLQVFGFLVLKEWNSWNDLFLSITEGLPHRILP